MNTVDAAAVERLLAETTAELAEWTAGRRSHTNVIMGFASGAEAQVMIAQADAAEVQRLSAAAQGFAAALAPLLQAQHDDDEDVRAAVEAVLTKWESLRGPSMFGQEVRAALSSPAPAEREPEAGGQS